MKLDFRICWFDDQEIKGLREQVAYKVSQLCFRPEILLVNPVRTDADSAPPEMNIGEGEGCTVWKVTDPVKVLPGLVERDFDLILVDYELGLEGMNGAKLSAEIRRHFRYTDIIFYSSKDRWELRNLMHEHQIDGVYSCHRDELVSEAVEIIHSMTRRSLDITNMRGIIVAAASDHDHHMNACLSALLAKMTKEERTELINALISKIQEQSKQSEKRLKKHSDAGEHDEILKHRAFDSSKKFQFLKKHLGNYKFPFDKPQAEEHFNSLRDTFGKYEEEVIKPRNALAHARTEKDSDGRITFKHEDLADLDHDKMKDLRSKLILHEENLIVLYKLLQNA